MQAPHYVLYTQSHLLHPSIPSATPHHLPQLPYHFRFSHVPKPWRGWASVSSNPDYAVCLRSRNPCIASPLPSKGQMENGKLTPKWAEADNPPHISPRANHVGRAVG